MIRYTDEMRVRALEVAMAGAEAALNLDARMTDPEADLRLGDRKGLSMKDRAESILKVAQNGQLEPRLYRLCWFVSRTA
jgi:hypothetical protein